MISSCFRINLKSMNLTVGWAPYKRDQLVEKPDAYREHKHREIAHIRVLLEPLFLLVDRAMALRTSDRKATVSG